MLSTAPQLKNGKIQGAVRTEYRDVQFGHVFGSRRFWYLPLAMFLVC